VDPNPAGFSTYWLSEVARTQLGFQGALFSDDICMAGAAVAGTLPERARAALAAGCDMVLVCNNPEGAAEVLADLSPVNSPLTQVRLMRMHGQQGISRAELHRDPRWQRSVREVAALVRSPELGLGDDALA
jgi:beta-N-acetylhexosaminidase